MSRFNVLLEIEGNSDRGEFNSFVQLSTRGICEGFSCLLAKSAVTVANNIPISSALSETERIRWRGDIPPSSHCSYLVQKIMYHLDNHLGGRPRGGYSMEFYHNERGWLSLNEETPLPSVPTTCRVLAVCAHGDGEVHAQPRNDVIAHENGTHSGISDGSGKGDGAGKSRPSRELLALPWRNFDLDFAGGGLILGGKPLVIRDVSNSDKGTGFFTWDGAVMLAKYLEHTMTMPHQHAGNLQGGQEKISLKYQRQGSVEGSVSGEGWHRGQGQGMWHPRRVLELGCGTGLAGLSAAALGAREVILSDLPYALENAEANAKINWDRFAQMEATVRVEKLDWREDIPPGLMDGGDFDLILAADVVWLDALILPLVNTLEKLTEGWAGIELDLGLGTERGMGPEAGPGNWGQAGATSREGTGSEGWVTGDLTPDRGGQTDFDTGTSGLACPVRNGSVPAHPADQGKREGQGQGPLGSDRGEGEVGRSSLEWREGKVGPGLRVGLG
ncbi:unnamed protein product, partial [Discosporangium mesarthrocarpum]